MILILIIKEFQVIFRDSKSLLSIIIPPLIQLLIFAFAATLDVKNVTVGIHNRDTGHHSFELLQRFKAAHVFDHMIELKNSQEIKPFIENQTGMVVLSIDSKFSRCLEADKSATVQIIVDGRRLNTAQILIGYCQNIITHFNKDFKSRAQLPNPAILMPRNWFNPNLIYPWFNIASLVSTLSMMICLVVTTQSIARERELGTFDQLLVSPLSSLHIVLGKMVPGILIGMAEGIIMLMVGVFIFHIPFTGSFIMFAVSLSFFVFSISGIGLFISSLAKTQQQAMLGTFVFMIPAILLSGYATPVENMPIWLQPISYLIPLHYMLKITKGLFFKDLPFLIVLKNLYPIILIGLLNFYGAVICFKRRLE